MSTLGAVSLSQPLMDDDLHQRQELVLYCVKSKHALGKDNIQLIFKNCDSKANKLN